MSIPMRKDLACSGEQNVVTALNAAACMTMTSYHTHTHRANNNTNIDLVRRRESGSPVTFTYYMARRGSRSRS